MVKVFVKRRRCATMQLGILLTSNHSSAGFITRNNGRSRIAANVVYSSSSSSSLRLPRERCDDRDVDANDEKWDNNESRVGIVVDTLEHKSRREALFLMFSSSLSTSVAVAHEEEPGECMNGRLVSESAVPGAYQQTCMNLDERRFHLESSSSMTGGGDTVTVYQGTNASGGGMAGRTGGCGAALSSIAVGKLVGAVGGGGGATSSVVIATDNNPEVLLLAKRNIERNNLSSVVRTAMLQWGSMAAMDYENCADIVIGSDLTYNSGSWLALAETMSTILKPEGIVVYLTLGHSGFNVGGELGGFLSVAENSGLKLLSMKFGTCGSIGDLLESVIAPEENDVIDANGGARVVILGKMTRKSHS